MSYNFPISPAAGTLYAPAGGPSWRFLDGAWQQEAPAGYPSSIRFETVSQATAATIPADINAIELTGYYAAGDGGGALYKRVVADPAHAGKIHSLDGAWWELAEERVTPYMFGAKGDNVADDIVPLQACFDYATNTRKVEVHCVGTFRIGAKLTIGGPVLSLSRSFYTDCVINTAFVSTLEAIRITNVHGTVWTGKLHLDCDTGSTYADRQQYDGIVLADCSDAAFGDLYVTGVKRNGITLLNNSNAASIDKLRGTNCGDQLAGTFSTAVNNGGANSVAQTTTLTVTTIPEALSIRDFIVYGGRPYAITAIDTGASTINVYPWVIAPVAGPITYVVGACVLFEGIDANIAQIGLISSNFCGVGYRIACLYPPFVQQLHSSGDGIACAVGSTSSSAWIGGHIGNFYVEGPTSHINFAEYSDANGASFSIDTLGPGAISQFFKLYANAGTNHAFRNLKTNIVNFAGRSYGVSGYLGGNATGGAVSPLLISSVSSFTSKHGDTMAVTLTWDDNNNRLFGLDTIYVQATGTGVRRNPTGTWTFNAPAGWTVLGQSAFSGMTQPTLFSVHFLLSTLQVAITPVTPDIDSVSVDMGTTTPVTVFPLSSERTLVWNTPFPASIGCTVSTTGARNGSRFRFVRTALATGAFVLNINPGPYKALAAGQWADMQHNGTIWQLTGFGSL